MLRELPLFLSEAGDQTLVNGAPGIENRREEQANIDPLDDVFGSAPASPILDSDYVAHSTGHDRSSTLDPSDIPRLRSTHVTSGYREGIAVGKEKHMQEGFDEGYTLGAELGLKAGWCLGALEGIWHALPAQADSTHTEPGGAPSASRDGVCELLAEAEEELEMQHLFGRQYFGEDGIWLYDVPGQDQESEETTFGKVADAHPVLLKWTAKVLAVSGEYCLQLQ